MTYKFISGTKIYINMPVAICDRGGPQVMGWVSSGTKKNLEVRTNSDFFYNYSMNFVKDKFSGTYVCKHEDAEGDVIFLYFFGDMPYLYKV